jgi:hypothetical protein
MIQSEMKNEIMIVGTTYDDALVPFSASLTMSTVGRGGDDNDSSDHSGSSARCERLHCCLGLWGL